MGEFLSAKTERKFLVEYPIETAYSALLDVFPLRYYKLEHHDDSIHSIKVFDVSNPYFVMHVYLNEYSKETSSVHFIADYPHAVSDIGGGCEKAIYTVLEAFMNELQKKPKSKGNDGLADFSGDIKIVDPMNFTNPIKSKKDTKTIALGYILCFSCFILPLAAFCFSNDMIPFAIFAAVICFSLAITAATLLQLGEKPRSVLHGRIITCLCGLFLIILGAFTHFMVSIVGIIIPVIVFAYFRNRGAY